jgi:hypothetical protein
MSTNNIDDNNPNNNNHDQQIDLDSLRNNFLSIEYFNLEQKLKNFSNEGKRESQELLDRIESIQLKLADRSIAKKEKLLRNLEEFRQYLLTIHKITEFTYDFIEDSYNNVVDPSITEKQKLDLAEEITKPILEKQNNKEVKPYKKRNPKPVPKPKKPRDMPDS